MSDPIICLQCGGVVDEGCAVPDGEQACSCAPASSAEAGRVTCPGCGGPLRVGARACPFCNSTLATCRCPACLAWNLAAAVHCQACGRELSAHAHPSGELGDLVCPRCDARLHARKYAQLDVDECDPCGGLFISPKMLDSIIASRDAPTGLQLALPRRAVYKESAVNYLKCPSCRNTMNRRMFGRISGVIVDVCRDHGVWFDSGELNEVLSWIERGGLELARQREKQELIDQARNLRTQQMAASSHAAISDPGPASLRSLRLGPGFGSEIVAAFVDLWRDLR